MKTTRTVLFLTLACGTALSQSTLAGPLDPPAGPVTSTFKTLTEVEPRTAINSVNTPTDGVAQFVINAPGSYYLPENVVVTTPGLRGIRINVSNVTIDLNGFSLIGSGVGDDAILVALMGTSNVTVRNGHIRDWVKEGVDGYHASNSRIEGVTVENCVAGYGLIAGPGSTFINCRVRGSGAGIVTTPGSTVRDCSAIGNGTGFAIGQGNTVSGCSSHDSTAGPGFQTQPGCTLTQCAAFNNRGATGHGFDIGAGSTVTACTATSNDQDGFHTQANANNVMISSSTSTANRANGIKTNVGIGFTVTGNNCSRNSGHGILVHSGSTIQNNICENNGTVVGASTSGIHIAGSFNRIDGNNVLGSAIGISVAAGLNNNIAIRNTATLCTTFYSFPAGVTYGAINFLPTGSFADTNSFANIRF